MIALSARTLASYVGTEAEPYSSTIEYEHRRTPSDRS